MSSLYLHPGLCFVGCVICALITSFTGRAVFVVPALGFLVLGMLLVAP